ncbi:hypothetical protein Btru_067430 [Bulinus truncatus]|nr:hypothetical protein Btru_067430 [Bulinus truncatus]
MTSDEVVYTSPFTANYSVISIDYTTSTPLFAFSKENRTIYVNDSIDAEKSPPDQKVEILCTDLSTGRKRSITVNIRIGDVNDNAPVFTKPVYSITVSELTDLSSTISTSVRAVDADLTPDNNIVYYSLLDGPFNEYFSLVQTISTDLLLVKKLDYKTVSQMNLTIMAKDNPRTGVQFNSTCLLIINIKDEDDQNPVFNASIYRGIVSSNATSGSVIPITPTIYAYDPDIGIHANVTYSFHDSTGQSNSILDIDPLTAVVRLKFKPVKAEVYLLIQATQVDNPSRYGVALLTIQVQGSNVNAPVFTRSSYNVVITESFPKGEVVTTVVASDADIGSIIIYRLDDPTSHFSINNKTGDIILIKDLGYANKSKYTLQVTASDGIWQTNATLIINIWPSNRNPPQILTSVNSVDAQRIKGYFIIKIEANYTDIGTKLSFKLMTFTDLFSIDQTGQIMITAEPLMLIYNTYPLTVVVSDNGQPNYESSVVITVNFPAISNALMFSKTYYNVVITETFPKGQIVTTVIAISSNPSTSIVYSLDDPSGHFSINAKTGDIILSQELSYKNKSLYEMNVTAIDGKIETSALLVISIWAVNRYPPQILTTTHQVNAQRNKGDIIIRIEANDSDAGNSLSYKLLTFNDLFSISQQGDIMITADADKYINDSYALTVVVSDGGVLESVAVITVQFPARTAALVARAEIDNTAAIVLGVLAGVFLIIIIALVVFICRRRLMDKEHLDRAKKPVTTNDTKGLAFRQKQGTFGRQAKINMSFIEDIDSNVQENPLNVSNKGDYYNFVQNDQDSENYDVQKNSFKNLNNGAYYNFEPSDQESGSSDIQVETTIQPEGSNQDYVLINDNSDKQSHVSIDSEEYSPTDKNTVPPFFRNGSLSTNHDSSDSEFSYSPSPVDSNAMKKMLTPGSLARTKVPEENLSFEDENSISLNTSSTMENMDLETVSLSPGFQKQELTVYF